MVAMVFLNISKNQFDRPRKNFFFGKSADFFFLERPPLSRKSQIHLRDPRLAIPDSLV